MQGRPAMAASCYCKTFRDVDRLAELTVKIAEHLMEEPLPRGVFLNVNFPNYRPEETTRFCTAPLGELLYEEKFGLVPLPGEPDTFIYQPSYTEKPPASADSDAGMVRARIVTLTPVSWDCTVADDGGCVSRLNQKMKDEMNLLA